MLMERLFQGLVLVGTRFGSFGAPAKTILNSAQAM